MQRPRSPPAPDHLPTPEPVRIHKNAFHLPPLLTSSALKMKYSVSYLDLLWVTTSSDINIWKKYENTKYLPSRVMWFEQKRNLSREDDVSWNKRMWKSVKYPSNRDSSRKLQRVSQVWVWGTGRAGQWVYTTVGDTDYSCRNAAIARGKDVQTTKPKPIKMVPLFCTAFSTGHGFRNWTSPSWWSPPLRNWPAPLLTTCLMSVKRNGASRF